MNEVLKINYEAEQPTVSARELHEALGVASRFSRWFDSNKELFVEGEDYNKCTSSTVVNNGARRELEEALARQKAEEERRKAEEADTGKGSENPEEAADTHDAPKKAEENDYTRVVSEPVMRIDFRVWGTKEQILALRDYMKQNNLKFGKVE